MKKTPIYSLSIISDKHYSKWQLHVQKQSLEQTSYAAKQESDCQIADVVFEVCYLKVAVFLQLRHHIDIL